MVFPSSSIFDNLTTVPQPNLQRPETVTPAGTPVGTAAGTAAGTGAGTGAETAASAAGLTVLTIHRIVTLSGADLALMTSAQGGTKNHAMGQWRTHGTAQLS
jgi:hypothetical protein